MNRRSRICDRLCPENVFPERTSHSGAHPSLAYVQYPVRASM